MTPVDSVLYHYVAGSVTKCASMHDESVFPPEIQAFLIMPSGLISMTTAILGISFSLHFLHAFADSGR